jgi:hypothetical protein
MLSQERLLKAIDEDMQVCQAAEPVPGDEPGRQQRILELATLTNHLQWAKRAGDDQAELEKIIVSLERIQNPVRGYQHWREVATVK